MANRHFGKIGDVWKHRPLAEILNIGTPRRYWESHAEAARYPLTHSHERDYGIYHFLDSQWNPKLRCGTVARSKSIVVHTLLWRGRNEHSKICELHRAIRATFAG